MFRTKVQLLSFTATYRFDIHHDYMRHGTTTVFAVFDVATEQVLGKCFQRHRSLEFRRFLKQIDESVPANLDVHLILDNYVTHETPAVQRWSTPCPRFHVHYTPTYGSWINFVER